ncbi:sigma-70 family RNA polymerase sigma factor [Amycolatopsis thermalba]|uniref:Sigma-70 family RNA polymerase sigma factor n=1 Tax=Amycolatopsis thermalba TaxID=944492 RepID=A0ABY4NRD2_9PSEU|nr:sigma-70 family RNA polymerase sigma factor [Amycolatopsis thermalba]UQS22606.1 sigma-70 family RNA polymerase sigma factor [Amycolatopsis thermalba]
MSTLSADFEGKSDAELITDVRTGTLAAYGTLYERHVSAAYNLARQLARSTAEADDLVSDAFAKVLDTLRAGKGPDSAFRAYLLTALRHTAYDKTRKDKRVDLNEDMTTVSAEALTVQFSDTAVAGLERTMAAKAFASLPERWQAVLWHTEIEQQSPAEVAPLLGLTPNGVSALAYRAREGLRQAYLQVHLAETSADKCRACADRLGAWTRDGLSKRERAQVEAHLDECADCRALAAELAEVNGALRAIIAPIVLGGAALGYLATAGKATAATVATAGAAAGSAGGAASVAAAGPRQFVGVGVSGVAVAAAVAAALAAGGGTQEIPAAASAPAPPPAVAPAQPPAPPAAPPAAPPPAPVVEPAPAPVAPPAPGPAPAPPPPAPGAPANITAEGPSSALELEPGGDPVALPITVRNNGGSVSDPVAATLNLPPGIRVVPAGGGGGGAGGFGTQAAPGPLLVNCPPGEGTVTCTTPRGLRPGESAVLTFLLKAEQGAASGQVTGSVNAGSNVRVSVSVPVSVAEAPDQVALEAKAVRSGQHVWGRSVWLSVDVTNTGPNTKPVTLSIDDEARLILGSFRAACDSGPTTTCTSLNALEPGEHLRLWFELDGPEKQARTVTVSATLGTAHASQTVTFDCWFPHCGVPLPGLAPTTTTTTSVTPSPSTTTTTTSRETTTTTTTTSSRTTTTTTTTSKDHGRPWWWLPWIPY